MFARYKVDKAREKRQAHGGRSIIETKEGGQIGKEWKYVKADGDGTKRKGSLLSP